MNGRSEWRATQEKRAALYRWLSTTFARELGVDAIEFYRSGEGRAFLEALSVETGTSETVGAMVAVFQAPQSAADLRIDLAAAFGSLFLGAGGAHAAPPYESFYKDEKGRLYQQATEAMDALLRQHDVHVGKDFKEPSDHVAVQLEMMAVLAADGGECEPGSDDARNAVSSQAEFLETHLLSWIPAFVDDCVSHDSSGFYAGAAGFLGSFLADDRSFCAAVLEDT